MIYEKEVSIYKPGATGDGIADAATSATDYLYETGSGDLIQAPDAPSSDTEAAAMTGYYTKTVASGAGAGFDVYKGEGSTGQKRIAHYGAEAVIGADDEAHTTIGSGRMAFDDDTQNLMFLGRTNNDTTGKAICQLALPLDHRTESSGSWVFTETFDLSFPQQTVSEIIGVGFTPLDSIEELTRNVQWTATVEDGLLTSVTITPDGVSRITDYIAQYEEVTGIIVKFLTTDNVQTYVLDNTSGDYVTPASPSIMTDAPGDGAFGIGGGHAYGDNSVAMAGGEAYGKRSFAFGYSSETGAARATKEGEVRFKSDKMAVEGEFMTFGSEGELTGWAFNSSYVNAASSSVHVYGLGDYVRIDGSIVTNANVPAGSTLVTGLPKSFFGGGDQADPRMRIFGRTVYPAVVTGTAGTLQAVLIANQWVDAGSITLPRAGTWLVRFNFNLTDNHGSGHVTGQINYGESGTTGVRNRQSVYFTNSSKDLCMTVTAIITTTRSASVPCRLYSTFGASNLANAYANISAVCIGGAGELDVAELNLVNDGTDAEKADLVTRGTVPIPSGSTIRFGTTYIRDSLWDGGYNG